MTKDNNASKQITNNAGLEHLTLEEVSKHLNMKISRIRSMIFKNQIPHSKFGASVRFNKEQFINWCESKAKGGSNDSAV
jgi:excisionase family DNA binding protein